MARRQLLSKDRIPMVQAHIHQGRVEVQDPIPAEWEGQWVKITPLAPDVPLPDREERLAALHAMGPIEFEEGERVAITNALTQLNAANKAAMEALASC
jgi:hypothetical protein